MQQEFHAAEKYPRQHKLVYLHLSMSVLAHPGTLRQSLDAGSSRTGGRNGLRRPRSIRRPAVQAQLPYPGRLELPVSYQSYDQASLGNRIGGTQGMAVGSRRLPLEKGKEKFCG